MSALHDLAEAAGLQIEWEDALGEAKRVADDSLISILAALGFPADGGAAISDSAAQIARDHDTCAFVSGIMGVPTLLPARCGAPGPAELVLEDGTRRDVVPIPDGERLILPAIAQPGYHHLAIGSRNINLAIAPQRCFTVADAVGGRRIWGPSVQIAALRDGGPAPFGDFGTLAAATRAFAARGADALAISPVHALFPADSSRYSPYAPSSRLFLNVLYADPTLVGATLPSMDSGELVDWEQAIPERLRILRGAYHARTDLVRAMVAEHASQGGEELERHARFDALHAHFFAKSGARGWQDWPAEYRDPAGSAVARFSAEHSEDVGFFLFLQWLAERSLNAAQQAAIGSGMALGLIADLAIGMDPGGSHAWSRSDELLTGLSIGAPPDILGPDGQSWGITGFSPNALQRSGFAPFIATLRAALDHAGGIRIDHALGLRRVWVVPEGMAPMHGAYLTMPMDDMLRVLALESHRARGIVIGEDLGTVPDGFRPAMDATAMLGMRVLWFERDENGGFLPPEDYGRAAAAMTGTHDLPTVAGWWRGRDIEWNWKLGRTSRAPDQSSAEAARGDQRTKLWGAFVGAGVACMPQPGRQDDARVVDAALAFVGRTSSSLALVPLEDIVGEVEQPNLPGTTDEHPNWRRRMPEATEALLERPEVVSRIGALNAARKSAQE